MASLSQTPLWIQAIVLGLIQGLTEFLPISSSGHLILLPELTHWKHLGKEFDVALHFGTLLAILAYFQEDVSLLFRGLDQVRRHWRPLTAGCSTGLPYEGRLVLQIGLASVPAAIVGLLLDDWLTAHFENVATIAFWLATFALLMFWAQRAGSQRLELHNLTLRGAVFIGLAQACALMPGVSRSGATMTAGLLFGLTRAESARFSFLMALPITAGACLLKGIKTAVHVQPSGDMGFLALCLIGITVSALSGWLCIRFLMRYLRKKTFTPFVVYRLCLSAFLVLWMLRH